VTGVRAAVAAALAGMLAGAPAVARAQTEAPKEARGAAEPAPGSSLVTLRHESFECFIVGRLSRIDVKAEPVTAVAEVRLLFKGPSDPEYYSIAMRQVGSEFTATLPRPTLSLGRIVYAIEARDPYGAVTRTPAASVPVAASSQCYNRRTAREGRAPVVVVVPPGLPAPVPQGFEAQDAMAHGEEITQKIGVFPGLTPGKALGAAIAVGAVAVGAGMLASGPEVQPGLPPTDPGGPVIVLSSATPPSGGTVHFAVAGEMELRFQLFFNRIPADVPRNGQLRASFYQGAPGVGPPCATLARGFNFFGQPDGIVAVSLIGPPLPGSCGVPVTTTSARVEIVSTNGRVFLSSGTPELPDLSLTYTFTR
jgi:hypothetical protein